MILVLNAGSSSLKYALGGDRGLVERVTDHHAALEEVLSRLHLDPATVRAVGHRVVHGGARFREPTLVDDEVLAEIKALVPLAPLHNPPAMAGIAAARSLLPEARHVAVFDTAFHSGLPDVAATYAIDTTVAHKHGIRRYGFHGISCAYVSGRAAELLGRPLAELNLIVLHLGNGASVTAVQGGRSVDTSMGFTPLEGLAMGTRCGDIDAAIVAFLQREAGMSADDVSELLNHRSGLLGLAGSNDMRTVLAARASGDAAAALAVAIYCRRIRKYVGAYHAVLGTVDAIVFTAGVGERAAPVRAESLAGLEPWGIAVDPARNNAPGDTARLISPPQARVPVCVVPTDEETAIARDVATLLGEGYA